MSPTAFHDAKQSLFVLAPDKGPVSMALAQPNANTLTEALRAIKSTVASQRASRATIPVVMSVLDLPEDSVANLAPQLVKALGKWGFTCVGFLDGSPCAEDLADDADLVVMPGAAQCSFADLADLARRVEAQRLLEEMLAAWDEAIVINAEIDRVAQARDWDEAIAENIAFDRAVEAKAWDEAIAQDEAFEAAREAARIKAEQELAQMLAHWDEAIAEDQAFEARLEAQAWDMALAFEDLLVQAEEAANQARTRVLATSPLYASMTMPPAPARPVLADIAPTPAQCQAVDPAPVAAPAKAVAVQAPTPPTASFDDAPVFSGLVDNDSDDGDVIDAPVATVPAMVHHARVRSGQQVHAVGGDLMMFGIVSAAAEIIADGNINAFAPVHGRMIAGAKGNRDAHITCQQFFGELVSIGGCFLTSDALPDDLTGAAVHFWLKDGKIHFNRLSAANKAA